MTRVGAHPNVLGFHGTWVDPRLQLVPQLVSTDAQQYRVLGLACCTCFALCVMFVLCVVCQVMEFVDGTLHDLCTKYRTTSRPRHGLVSMLVDVALGVLNALRALLEHADGAIVHQDVKDDNIFLVVDSLGTVLCVKLGDFGSAKVRGNAGGGGWWGRGRCVLREGKTKDMNVNVNVSADGVCNGAPGRGVCGWERIHPSPGGVAGSGVLPQ
jgi:serine/threonine protein kinase